MNKLRFSIVGGYLAATLGGCGKTPDSSTFSSVYSNILQKACIECHVPSGAATHDFSVKLDFTTQATAFQTLTTQNVSASDTSTCSAAKIVKAGDPTHSYLAAVLFSDYPQSGFGGISGCTPYNGHHQDQHLSDTEKTSLIKWIQDGAQNN